MNENWSQNFSIFYVLIVQGLSGIAKDLTKMSSKSAVKLLAPDNQSSLFKWVAILTGSKNAVKGFGFLLGCTLLATIGFYNSLISMVVIVTFILVCSFIFLKEDNKKINLVDISKNWVLYLLINLILLTFLLFFFSEIFLTTIFLFSGLFIFWISKMNRI